MKERNVTAKRTYKDTVFRMLFKEKDRLLELYNAVSGKNYVNAEDLQVVTLENAIYISMKNDLAFMIDARLCMYEHQSTVNPNIPYRFLEYVAEEFGGQIAGRNIYGSSLIRLPAPHFVVFYNGMARQPERQIVKLSDAYIQKEDDPQLELKVLVLNINVGYNEQIKEQCRALGEYTEYINRVQKYSGMTSLEKAVETAVDECIREDILRDFLLKNRAEVSRMTIYEFDEELYEKGIREEGREEGACEATAKMTIKLLETLEPVSDELRQRIQEERNIEKLEKWHLLAAKADSIAEWRKKIQE